MDNDILMALAGFLILQVIILCVALRHAMSIDTRNKQNEEIIQLLTDIKNKD